MEIQDELKEVLEAETTTEEEATTEESTVVETNEESTEVDNELSNDELERKRQKQLKNRPSNRIFHFKTKYRNEQAANEELRRENAELKANAPQKQELKAPDEDDYSTHAEYKEAHDEFIISEREAYAQKRVQEDRDLRTQETRREQEAANGKKASERWKKMATKATKKNEDYREVENDFILAAKAGRSEGIYKELYDCTNPTDIIYSLTKDNDEGLEEFFELTPRQQKNKIMELDIDFRKTTVKGDSPSYRPTPNIRGGGGSQQKSRGRESQYDYNRRKNGLI